MTQTPVVPLEKLFAQVLDPASRANPYPLYARLRQAPVSVQDDGTYVVSTYREINLLLHDPRISSDERKSAHPAGALTGTAEATTPSLIFTDPPEHTQLRCRSRSSAGCSGCRARTNRAFVAGPRPWCARLIR